MKMLVQTNAELKELAQSQKELAQAQKETDRCLKALINSLRNGRRARTRITSSKTVAEAETHGETRRTPLKGAVKVRKS